MRKNISYIIAVFITATVISGCSTQENTLLTRTYHQITSRYNIFFNAEQSFNEGLRKIEQNFSYDYARILPVFIYTDPELALLAESDMDRAIRKAGKIISNKSITARPRERGGVFERGPDFYNKREYNRWVLESYLLTGKAYFYKHDYDAAIRTFRFMTVEYDIDPIRYDAKIWLARSYSETGRFNEARILLKRLEDDPDFPERLKAELNKTQADYYLKNAEYGKPIPLLENLLETGASGRERRRFTYILAQLNEITGNLEKAAHYYRQVARMNPDYEMALNAQMGLAGAYPSGSPENRELTSDLYSMLDDPRNREYLDQIYFALGNLYEIEGNSEKALEMFTISASTSGTGSSARVRAYETLGEIYFERRDYSRAEAYYDSTVKYMEKHNPGFEYIFNKRNILSELVGYLDIYKLEDSLQMLAAMPEEDLKNEIDRIIALREKEQSDALLAAREMESSESRLNLRDLQSLRVQAERSSDGKWYFYNQSAVNFGKAEFQAVWGSRRLEDNWRRESQESIMAESTEEREYTGEEDPVAEPAEEAPEGSLMFYLQDLPLTEESLFESNERIKSALSGMSRVYTEYLQDYENASWALEEYIKRFPDDEYIPVKYYRLYEIYNKEGNTSRAGYFSQRLTEEFPESRYARILEDPRYLEKMAEMEEEAEEFYEETRQLYVAGEYTRVVERVSDARLKYQGSLLIPLFEYLEILSYAGTYGNIPELKKELASFIDKYPGSEMSENASYLLTFLEEDYPDIAEETGLIAASADFKSDETGEHFFVVMIDNREELINRMVFNIINFNVENFPRLSMEVNSENFSSARQMLVIRGLEDRETAMEYLKLFESDEKVFIEVKEEAENLIMFIISPANFRIFKDEKNTGNYMRFFGEEYDG